MNKPAIMIAAALFVLNGCATPPVTSDNPTPIPPERLAGFQTNISQGATIVVNRDSGFLSGAGCLVSVLIDGKTAARIDAGETGTFIVNPGHHMIAVSGDPSRAAHCAGLPVSPPAQSATVLKTGQIQKFRISGGEKTALDIRPTGL